MSELPRDLSKEKLFHSEKGSDIWTLRPEYWDRFPYFELRKPSLEQLTTFEHLLLGKHQDTGKLIPKEDNPFVQFLDAQRSVQPRDGLSPKEFIPPGERKRFERDALAEKHGKDHGAHFRLEFSQEPIPIGARFIDRGTESQQPGTNGFSFLSQDIDMELPDQEIRVNQLSPNLKLPERKSLVVTDRSRPDDARRAAAPTYVDVDSISPRAFQKNNGVRNAQAQKVLDIVHEFGHLIADEGPGAEFSPLPGHIIPYQRILDGKTKQVEKEDILADPAERFARDVGLAYGYITSERQYLESRVSAYQRKLTEENIGNGEELKKFLERREREEAQKRATPPAQEAQQSISQTATDPVKMRLAVSNGTLTLQSLMNDAWQDVATQPAGQLRAGYYSLSLATLADPSKSYAGMALYADDRYVYQQVGRAVVKHDRSEFALAPDPGEWQQIAYQNGQAVVTELSAQTRGKGLTA